LISIQKPPLEKLIRVLKRYFSSTPARPKGIRTGSSEHFMDNVSKMPKSPFLESVEAFMRVHRYSRRTIDSYLYCIKLFILFSGKQHPSVLGDEELRGPVLSFAFRHNREVRSRITIFQQTEKPRYRPPCDGMRVALSAGQGVRKGNGVRYHLAWLPCSADDCGGALPGRLVSWLSFLQQDAPGSVLVAGRIDCDACLAVYCLLTKC
jgi:hypothetical protein